MCQQPSLHLQQVCRSPMNSLPVLDVRVLHKNSTSMSLTNKSAALQGDCKTPMNHVQDMRDLHKNSPSLNPKSVETRTPNDIDRSHSHPPYIAKLPPTACQFHHFAINHRNFEFCVVATFQV